MRATAPAEAGPEALEFAAKPGWLALTFAIVPALVVLQSAYVLMVKPVPVLLIILLVAVMAACGLLAAKALEGVLPTQVQFTAEGIEIAKTFGAASYKWHEIEDIKLVPAPGTLADDPNRASAQRIGVGLFLKENAKDRIDPNHADFVLFVGTDDDTAQLLGIMERINTHRAKKIPLTARGPAKIGQRRAPAARVQSEFRRKQEAAPS